MAKNAVNKKKMSDIAHLAGVSESTVSRALSNSSLINAKTRERILAIAKEQNYTVNTQARSLRLQSSKIVSVIIPSDHDPRQHISDPFFLELLGGIADALSEVNYDLLLSRVHTRDWRKRVASHSYVDGLVIVGQSDLNQDLNDFAKYNTLPMVVWGAKLADQNYISVGTDNFIGGEIATQHLIRAGKKRIVFLGDPSLLEVGLRHDGYCAALKAAGIVYDPALICPCGFSRESGEQALRSFLKSGQAFDGLFAVSDVLASLVIKQLGAQGLHVPRDIAVVGFDDISIAGNMAPALTTVSQSIHEGAYALVDHLFKQIRSEAVTSLVLPPVLVKRESA